ncbi:MAG: heparan-alpha-glucosaminide N-acetyltransferase domain-containing protein [Promethearchaeota archaeon]
MKNEIKEESEDLIVETDQIQPRRIDSLDVTRGVAMMFIILLHFCLAWLAENVVFLASAGQIFLEFLGPGMFIVLSTISVVFTVKSKKGKLPEKVIRNSIYLRGLFIIVTGFVYNFFSLIVWGWNILMFIGFAQIFTYYALKLRTSTRIIIGLIILFSSEFIRNLFWILQNGNIFYWIINFIISSPQPQVTLLPWLSVCFLAPVFGEYIYDTMIKGTEEQYKKLVKVFLICGIIITLIGIFIGLDQKYFTDVLYNLYTPEGAYPYVNLLRMWNWQYFAPVTGLVKFLITGTYSNVLYTLGLDLITIAIIFHVIDIMKKDNIFIRMLKFYGKVSLTLFLIEYIFIPLFVGRFSVIDFLILVFPFIGFLGILMFLWNKYGKGGVGSLEWLAGYLLGSKKSQVK